MPIGFWGISRSELESMWDCRTHRKLTRQELDKIIRELPEKLDTVIYEAFDRLQNNQAKK